MGKEHLFIAAGGKGARLGDLTKDVPKPLVVVEGKPIIDHIIEACLEAGLEDITVKVSYMKDQIIRHLAPRVNFEENDTDEITEPLFHFVEAKRPELTIGLNGDTLIRPESLRRLIKLMNDNPGADAAVVVTKVTKPNLDASWVYWKHRIENGCLVSLEERSIREVDTEHVASIYKTAALEKLSDNFRNSFSDHRILPFKSYSLLWNYLLRLFLWKNLTVAGIVTDDLCLNINKPKDLEEAEYFFRDPSYFRFRRLTPDGFNEPIIDEKSLILIPPASEQDQILLAAFECMNKLGLRLVENQRVTLTHEMVKEWQKCSKFAGNSAAIDHLLGGSSVIFIVEGRGAFYKALLMCDTLNRDNSELLEGKLLEATYSECSFEDQFNRQISILRGLLPAKHLFVKITK